MGHGENNTKKKMNFKFNAEHTFFTSDTHFNHANIIKFCNRPFKDVEQMNDVMIANWNGVIGKDDTVFHLGDYPPETRPRFRLPFRSWSAVLNAANS